MRNAGRGEASLALTLAAVCLALSTGLASATIIDPVTAATDFKLGNTVTYGGASLASNATGASGGGPGFTLPSGAKAGQIDLSNLNVNGVALNGSPATNNYLLATWCVDIYNALTSKTQNTVEGSSGIVYGKSASTVAPITGALLNELTALVQWGYENINVSSFTYKGHTGLASAAVQLAIWDLVYGQYGGAAGSASGKYQATSGDKTDTNSLANLLLNAALLLGNGTKNGAGYDGIVLITQDSNSDPGHTITYSLEELLPALKTGEHPSYVSQDLIFLTELVTSSSLTTPLPPTWAMMLAALLGFGFYRRRALRSNLP